MLPFRAHVRRQGSRWTWEVRQGRGSTTKHRAGSAATRSEAIRAAFRPIPAQAVQEQPASQSHQQAA